MSRLKIYKEGSENTTIVANRFIDDYMKDANDAQIKVYLFLLRTFQAEEATTVADIADKFNHTEKDVIRALKYWEKMRLLCLEYDEDKTLVGIRLKDIRGEVPSRRYSPVTLSLTSETDSVDSDSDSDSDRDTDSETTASVASRTSADDTAAFPGSDDVVYTRASGRSGQIPAGKEETYSYSKPVYSASELKEFRSRDNTEQILLIAEQYIGRPLSVSDMKSILFFTDVLKLSDDLIDYLLQYCVELGKKDFKYIEKVAISWAERGIATPEEARKSSVKYDKKVYQIMNALGKNTSPTDKEMEFISRWTKDYAFSTEIIIEACERTVLATDKHRFEYADGILTRWHNENVHYPADIRKMDDMYRQKKKSSAPAKSASNNKFNQFTQNEYDFDALEQKLISN